MSSRRTFTSPLHDVARAVLMPLKAVFIVGLCGLINWLTFSGTWWVKWVALGMGIASALALVRGLRALLVWGFIAWIGWKIYQRHGDTARRAFDDWAAQERRDPAQLLQAWWRARQQPGTPGPATSTGSPT